MKSGKSDRSVAAVVSCYCLVIVAAVIVLGPFRARGIVSVVCCIVHSKGIEPLM